MIYGKKQLNMIFLIDLLSFKCNFAGSKI